MRLRRSSRTRAAFALAVALATGSFARLQAAPPEGTLSFRVCQYNVHFDYEDDGPEHRWVKRRDLCAGLLLASKATVCCIQEDKTDQVEDLKARMPGWQFVGRGRLADGQGEHNSVIFKPDTWTCVDHGDFWLSDTPDVPGSNTWGSKYTHKATWARLRLSSGGKAGDVVFVSTHLDENVGMDEARRKSAVCIRDYLGKHWKGSNIVVCGDFNSAVTDPSHEVMADTKIEPPLHDVWDASKAHDPAPGTVHHWTGVAKTKRIDWIFMGGKISADGMNVDRWNKDGRYGSYHFALEADLRVEATQTSAASSSSSSSSTSPRKPALEPQVK